MTFVWTLSDLISVVFVFGAVLCFAGAVLLVCVHRMRRRLRGRR